jgi:glycolate oxidase FAD binding subunit
VGNAVGILLVALKGDLDQAKNAIESLRAAVASMDGHMVVQRAPRELRRQVDVWGPGENAALMRKLKQEFDPHGVLNPGRFVAGI